jgi:hypothetical protein
MESKYKMLKNIAYLCQGLAWIGGVLWIVNAIIFFYTYFTSKIDLPKIGDLVTGYGGGIIAAIIPIILLYAVGGLIYLLIDIEHNTRKG